MNIKSLFCNEAYSLYDTVNAYPSVGVHIRNFTNGVGTVTDMVLALHEQGIVVESITDHLVVLELNHKRCAIDCY